MTHQIVPKPSLQGLCNSRKAVSIKHFLAESIRDAFRSLGAADRSDMLISPSIAKFRGVGDRLVPENIPRCPVLSVISAVCY